jgi:hypothetical protein
MCTHTHAVDHIGIHPQDPDYVYGIHPQDPDYVYYVRILTSTEYTVKDEYHAQAASAASSE